MTHGTTTTTKSSIRASSFLSPVHEQNNFRKQSPKKVEKSTELFVNTKSCQNVRTNNERSNEFQRQITRSPHDQKN